MSEEKFPGDPSLPSSKEELNKLIACGESSHKYSVEDFFKNPEQTAFQISPDGKYLSFMGPYKRRKNLFVQEVGSDQVKRITNETSRDIAGFVWVNHERIVFLRDTGGDENFQLYAVNKNGQSAVELTPYNEVRIQIIDRLHEDDDHIIIGMNKENPMLFEPYRINVYDGTLTKLANNDDPLRPINDWITDDQGKLRLAVRIDGGVNSTILYRNDESEEFTEVLTTDFKNAFQPMVFEPDQPHIAYVSTNIGRDKSVIVRYDMLASEEIGDPIYSHPEVDVEQILWSRKKKSLTGVVFTTWKSQFHFFDKEWKDLMNRVQNRLKDYEVVAVSKDKDENIWIFRTYSDRSLGAFYMYDKSSDQINKIADVSPWLDEEDMSEMKPIVYSTRDGLEIPGYISLPKNPEGKAVPFIIHPHGGPWVRDSWGYNPAVQFLTSRGFGVFQMNYRGSTGYGKTFWTSSFKKWGQEMQHDITDGVQWLIEQGYADKDRIAIFGGSYGGYATLAGISFTPDLYCCAVDFVGVSNLFTFMTTIPPYWKPYLDMFYEMVGHPERDKKLLEAGSPIFHTDKIKAPLFVVQGANDPRVNIDESDQIVRNLRARGIDVPYMVKYDEGHGFANEENRFEFYKAMIGFLVKHTH